MIWVLHDYNVPMLGVVCSSLSKKQFIQQHLSPSSAITLGDIWFGGKILSRPISLPRTQLRIIPIAAYTLDIPFGSAVKSQACLSLVLG